jgi:hypothetical protein
MLTHLLPLQGTLNTDGITADARKIAAFVIIAIGIGLIAKAKSGQMGYVIAVAVVAAFGAFIAWQPGQFATAAGNLIGGLLNAR